MTPEQMRAEDIRRIQTPIALEEAQDYAIGQWASLSVELRPTEDRAGTGRITPPYLKRRFTYLSRDKFIGIITMFADNYGQLPLLELEFKGSLRWGQPHPIAEGAWETDYLLDEGFGVTPLHPDAAAMLNQVPVAGLPPFEAGAQQDILSRPFPLFNINAGQIVGDYDLLYFSHGLLFMGAKHVDGTPFDQPERRPHQLQIPLVRISGFRLFEALEQHFGLQIDHGRRTFQAQAADEETAAAMGLAAGDPAMHIEQQTYLSDGRLIEFSDLWLRGDQFKLSAQVQRTGSPATGLAVSLLQTVQS